MNNASITKFGALAIGAFLVGGTMTSAAGNLMSFEEPSAMSVVAIFIGPVLFNTILAWLLYSYAGRIDLQPQDGAESNILVAGLKLLGFYLIALGIPAILGAWIYSATGSATTEIKHVLMQNAVTSVVEILIGYILIWHTPRLTKLGC